MGPDLEFALSLADDADAKFCEERIGRIRTAAMTLLTSGLIVDSTGRAPAIERQPMFATLERLLVMEVLIHHVDTLRFLLGPLALHTSVIGRSCTLVRGEDRYGHFVKETRLGTPMSPEAQAAHAEAVRLFRLRQDQGFTKAAE